MSKSLGDFDASAVIYGKFTTYRPTTGAAYTLAGTPALSVYKDNSTTQSTTGVTLTADFDSVTGLNHFAIDTSADGTFYAAGSFFDIVITTGTIDSVSVVGGSVACFTIRKTSALKPTTAGRTLVVDAAGLADANTVKLGPTGSGTAQTAKDVGGAVPAVAAGAANGLIINGSNTGPMSISGGVTFSSSTGAGLTCSSSNSGSSGISSVGSGSGSGILASGGGTGHGLNCVGGGTSGSGLRASGQPAFDATASAGNQPGIYAKGSGTGAGLKAEGGSSGSGLYAVAASGFGMQVDGTSYGMSITASSGIGFSASGTSAGGNFTGSAGTGLNVASAGSNGPGVTIAGNGSGAGIKSTGGATGEALKLVGGGTSGVGIAITTTSGDGLSITPTAGNGIVTTGNGSGKFGVAATSGTGTAYGISAVGTTAGLYVEATGTDADGMLAIGTGTGNSIDGSQKGISGVLVATVDAASIRAAIGMASANLDTQLTTIDDYIDTEVGAIYSRLGAPAGASMSADVAAVKVDTAAIKAKTDNLPPVIKKNTAFSNFEFYMIDTADHVSAITGLGAGVTAERSIDGAAFAACANAVAEVGSGVYKINLAAADLNGTMITLKFTATGADATVIGIPTNA